MTAVVEFEGLGEFGRESFRCEERCGGRSEESGESESGCHCWELRIGFLGTISVK